MMKVESQSLDFNPDPVVSALKAVGKSNGLKKTNLNWRKQSDETVLTINLQKSYWGKQYYINVRVGLLEKSSLPGDYDMQFRIENLLLSSESSRMGELLDLEKPIDDKKRYHELVGYLTRLIPLLLTELSTKEGMKALYDKEFALTETDVWKYF